MLSHYNLYYKMPFFSYKIQNKLFWLIMITQQNINVILDHVRGVVCVKGVGEMQQKAGELVHFRCIS